jgi:hypothetical protein
MELKILFHGYGIVNINGRSFHKTFQTKKEAVTFLTGYEIGTLNRRREWNLARRNGWRIKPVFVALN